MFEHFTFGLQAQTHRDPEEEFSASPTDTSFPSPLSPFPQSACSTSSSFSSWLSSSALSPIPQNPEISDIVIKLSSHSLSQDEEPQQSLWSSQTQSQSQNTLFSNNTPDPDPDPFSEEELSFVSTTHNMSTIHTKSLPSLPPTQTPTVACRRLQRQLNVQLQSCSNHVRDINTLVEDMIISNSQCRLHTHTHSHSRHHIHKFPSRLSPPSPSPNTDTDELVVDTTEADDRDQDQDVNMDRESGIDTETDTSARARLQIADPDEDEGFGDDYDLLTVMKEEISLRRASTPIGIRKYNNNSGLKYRKSAECVGGNGIGGARLKVKCVPRMRRRKVKKVIE